MIRYSVVISVVGLVIQGFSAVMVIPFLVAMMLREYNSAGLILLSTLFGILIGRMAMRCNPGRNFDDLGRIEGMGIVAFSWLGVAIVGSIPYIGFGLGIVDSLFESMSGFTTTGATIFSHFSLYNQSLFFYRGFTQWLGGMGILVLFVAILPHLAISGRQLFFAETSSASQEKLTPRISHTAQNLWSWYFFLTLIEAITLYMVGMPLIDSFSNTFTTMAAGGFSPHPQSIMGYHSAAVEWVIIFFMFLAGANFTLQVKAVKGKPSAFFSNSELKVYALIVVVATAILTFVLRSSGPETGIIENLRTALFQNLSIITTTGFASVDFEQWTDTAKAVIFVLMFIGGCSGSAGGGIKVVRLLLLVKYISKMLLRTVYPNAVVTVKLQNKTFKEKEIQPVFSFVVLYFLFFAIGGTLASLIENNLIVGYTGAIATLGNIGPGFGLIGPMGSFAGLHWLTKCIFIFLMWAGRLEIMALAVFLRVETWRDSRWK
ncbi:MAG: TrkH family potassium uptake protein [Candidatus Rifleibacteriota bacterium]